ncbi:hypothetical protein [Hymenobacter cellulosilyticus]|uniref:hypothetical protein n=1 Tax=Hymenobacter cellulosilyticus TaxID=2932248 RepID=UPI0028804E2B|nr:hypothetical protein [Hymenobacter cellulosilyticus]
MSANGTSPDLSAIKAFIFDVDGVLTDGTLLALNSGSRPGPFTFATATPFAMPWPAATASSSSRGGRKKACAAVWSPWTCTTSSWGWPTR